MVYIDGNHHPMAHHAACRSLATTLLVLLVAVSSSSRYDQLGVSGAECGSLCSGVLRQLYDDTVGAAWTESAATTRSRPSNFLAAASQGQFLLRWGP
jgi:hypothetical protein